MSNRRKLRPQHPLTAIIAPLDGAKIRGGCGSCNAYQVVHAHAHGADVHLIRVYHDRGCPWLTAREARHDRRAR